LWPSHISVMLIRKVRKVNEFKLTSVVCINAIPLEKFPRNSRWLLRWYPIDICRPLTVGVPSCLVQLGLMGNAHIPYPSDYSCRIVSVYPRPFDWQVSPSSIGPLSLGSCTLLHMLPVGSSSITPASLDGTNVVVVLEQCSWLMIRGRDGYGQHILWKHGLQVYFPVRPPSVMVCDRGWLNNVTCLVA